MMRQPLWFETVPAAMGILAGVLSIASAPVQIRLPIVLTFLLLGPGAAIVGLLKLTDPLHQLTLVLAISISASSVVSIVLLYAGWWSPNEILLIVIAITFAAAGGARILRERPDWLDFVRLPKVRRLWFR